MAVGSKQPRSRASLSLSKCDRNFRSCTSLDASFATGLFGAEDRLAGGKGFGDKGDHEAREAEGTKVLSFWESRDGNDVEVEVWIVGEAD